MAEKIQASYKVLYVPDQLSNEAYASIMKEPSLTGSHFCDKICRYGDSWNW